MKGIPTARKNYVILFFTIVSLMLLNSCGGVTPNSYTITATAGVGGSISPSGSIPVVEGNSQSFIITPNIGYETSNVLVDGTLVGAVATYTFTDVDQDHTIQANFIVLVPKVYNPDNGFEYMTIQDAINAGQIGDTFIVNPGIFRENIVFDGKDIIVCSSDPSNPDIVAGTIIDGGKNDSVVRFIGGDNSTLEGFTIRNGNTGGDGGGIYIGDSSPTIKNNTITGNTASKTGGGINIYNSFPVIADNTVKGNDAHDGGGISMHFSSPIINGNVITDNAGYYGGGIYMLNLSPNITNNTITDNGATIGGGIYVSYSSPMIEGNIITGNRAINQGGGIAVSKGSTLMPADIRPIGWGSGQEKIPTGVTLVPAEGVEYTIASNTLFGNKQGNPLSYSEGAHVYFY